MLSATPISISKGPDTQGSVWQAGPAGPEPVLQGPLTVAPGFNVPAGNASDADVPVSNPPNAIVPDPKALAIPAVPSGPAVSEQVAALCWRLHKGRTQVLMVTSRDTGRWVLPKGWPIIGLTPEAAAAREAWEEAGVEGRVATPSLGRYSYDKLRPGAETLPCSVDVFPLRVQNLKSAFPERHQRRRKWFAADDAAGLVAEHDLRALLMRLYENPALLTPLVQRKRRKSQR